MYFNFTLCSIRLSLIFLILFQAYTLAQWDDPNIDQVPKEFINFPPAQSPQGQEAVITDTAGYDNFNLGTAFAEPHLVQNPTNPPQYFASFNINTAYRTNNAFDWTTSTPPFGVSVQGDPVNAYDSLGNLFYESMFGNITGCKVIRSTDNGANWFPSVTSVAGRDKNWIAADQTSGPFANYIYTTMTGPSTGSVGNFARSTDFGTTFTQTFTFNTQSLPGMMVAVGPNVIGTDIPGGCVYVVTNSGSSFASTYTFYVSTNGGTSFTLKSAQNFSNYVGTDVSGRNSVQNMRTRPYPFITVDNSYGPFRGRLYLVYASNTPAGNGNKPDIFCRYSNDQGATWSSPMVVNDDINTTSNHQWHPSIWCDKTSGRLFVKWMDTRDTPTSDSAHIYASYSDDGGVTFAANQRITTAKMKINCTTCGGGGTPRYQGDYDAITALDNQALMVWTDFRAGTFGSYVGYFPDFAMKIFPSADTLFNDMDSTVINISIPSVKLFDKIVKFSAAVSPLPSSGSINFEFQNGDSLFSFPDTLSLKIVTSDAVNPGIYSILITGQGPNGTPVHKRNVTLNVLPIIKTLHVTTFVEGLFNGTTTVSDTVTLELRNTTAPFALLESKKIFLNSLGFGIGSFTNVSDGTPFYLAFKHRNGLETWSSTGKSFTSGSLSYDFTDDSTKAFGLNMVKKGTKWCIYSGDVNRDGVIDIADILLIDTDNLSFSAGYLSTDLNGDQLVDLTDLILADTNNLKFISKIVPTLRRDVSNSSAQEVY